MKESIYNKVKQILEDHPRARESYPVLHKHFYNTEESFHDALRKMYEGDLPKLGTVERARRMVQESNPELRGDTYDYRVDKEECIRQSINIKSEEILMEL